MFVPHFNAGFLPAHPLSDTAVEQIRELVDHAAAFRWWRG